MSPIIDMNDVVTFLSFSFRADVVFGFLFRELLLFLVVSKLQWPENDLSLDYGQRCSKPNGNLQIAKIKRVIDVE